MPVTILHTHTHTHARTHAHTRTHTRAHTYTHKYLWVILNTVCCAVYSAMFARRRRIESCWSAVTSLVYLTPGVDGIILHCGLVWTMARRVTAPRRQQDSAQGLSASQEGEIEREGRPWTVVHWLNVRDFL